MSVEISEKLQRTLSWIVSIAISVLCCSALFVLFASYLVDVKMGLRDNNARINAVEEREDRILTEVEQLRKHVMPQPVAAAPAAVPAVAPAPASENSTGLAVGGAKESEGMPSSEPPLAIPATQTAPAPAAPAAPQVLVPVMPVPAEKK